MICQDITSTKHLAYAAFKDALTGLSNRRGFKTLVMDRCDEAVCSRTNFSLVVVDLNGLKAINDIFGHSVGDEAIRSVGAWLGGLVRSGEAVARVGGDEFHMLLEEPTQELLGRRPQSLRMSAAGGLKIPNTPHQIAVSTGGAVWHLGDDAEQVLTAADAAMYAQKNSYRRANAPVDSVVRAS